MSTFNWEHRNASFDIVPTKDLFKIYPQAVPRSSTLQPSTSTFHGGPAQNNRTLQKTRDDEVYSLPVDATEEAKQEWENENRRKLQDRFKKNEQHVYHTISLK